MSNVFISHSSNDKPFVKRLASALASEGFPVWLDSWKLELGDSLTDRIYDGIDSSSMVLLVVSRHAIDSGWVNRELNAALSREEQVGRKFLVPIKIDDCQAPLKVADRLYADFSTSFSSPLGRVVRILESNGCRELAVPLEREQLCLSFTREVNLDCVSLRKAIDHIGGRQGHLKLDPAQIVMNEDKDAELLLERLHSRIDNISEDRYYSPELESALRGALSDITRNDRFLAEGICLFLANHPDVDAIYWFARILRARNAYTLWQMQSPDSEVLEYGRTWRSGGLTSNVDAAVFFEVEYVRPVDFWKKENASRSPYYHVWLDRKETEALEGYHGVPGDFGDIGPAAIDKFIYPQMVLQHLADKRGRGPVIWNLSQALIGIS
ncbi:toll/interleukin-1 receptor domain-containing protein [Bradyrhizobium sp. AT1]|uniref:toll/interleukin-1 receptor domain-containing protein n=1 Tax=Bradyrhizobium sp. AT1 TaxID=574934 RepID=UPI000A069B74|nr:toll/interleukin-1 receptor domain-containing protein [Bradyrhizobium sp. AT1]